MLDTLTSCCGMFLLFVFTFAIAFVYQFIVRLWQYFSERNVRYVRGLPVLGSAYKSVLGIEPAAVAYRRCYDQFPTQKLMGIYEFGGRPSYLIRNPDLIKQLMITDADHFSDNKLTFENDLLGHTSFGLQKSTNALSSALTGNKLRLMHSLMVKASEKFVNTVKDTDKTAKIFNCRHLFGRYATDTIAASALGIELNSLHDTNNDLFMAGRKLSEFNHFNALKFLANSSFPTAVKLVNAFVTEETHAKMLKKIAKDSIETRKEKKSSETILIDFLIKARDGQASDDGGDDKTNIGFSIPTEQLNINKLSEEIKKWTDDDIVVQCAKFFLSELNSISTIASFMFHELALNPDIQDKLFAEIDSVKRELNGSPLTYEVIPKLKYLDMVLCETLRRWSPVPFFERSCNQPYVLENSNGSNVELQVGESVFIPVYALHMDERYFRKSHKFDPERFSDENKDKIQPGTYLPFGLGSRTYVGSRYAVVAIKTLAFHLLSEFYIDKSFKTQDPLKLKALPLLMDAERGFFIELRRRDPDRSPYKSQVFT